MSEPKVFTADGHELSGEMLTKSQLSDEIPFATDTSCCWREDLCIEFFDQWAIGVAWGICDRGGKFSFSTMAVVKVLDTGGCGAETLTSLVLGVVLIRGKASVIIRQGGTCGK